MELFKEKNIENYRCTSLLYEGKLLLYACNVECEECGAPTDEIIIGAKVRKTNKKLGSNCLFNSWKSRNVWFQI